MEVVTLEVGPAPHVVFQSIGGDLRLSGWEDANLEAKAPRGGELMVDQQEDRLVITCHSDCLVFLPAASRVEVHGVGGDTRVTGISGALMLGTIGGDVSLRRVGEVVVGQAGGDLQARGVAGDLSIKSGGGDAVVERVEGNVRIQAQGGDLRLRRVKGTVEAHVGGDASLTLSPSPGSSSKVLAGGDLACRLPEEASARIAIQAGGEVHLRGVPDPQTADEGLVVRMGEGEAEVQLHAGGDLWVRAGDLEDVDLEFDLGEDVAARIESKMAEMEARLGALGAGVFAFDSERIGTQVRRAVTRAMRKAAGARKRAVVGKAWGRRAGPAVFSAYGVAGRRAQEEERLMILGMLEKGTISVEEAEKLLKALEGEA